jgi:hypothetical protein
MKNSELNILFLDSLDGRIVNQIMSNIANHYGITYQEALYEVMDEEAESIMDYITGSLRSTVSLFFKNFKLNLA